MHVLMKNIVNPLMRWLLQSPLHGLLSRWFTLLTVTGLTSRQKYVIPVNYARTGETITILSQRKRTWWKNLRDGAPVSLRLAGETIPAHAQIVPATNPDFVPAVQHYFRQLMRRTVTGGEAAALADKTVVIRVEPTSPPPERGN